MALNILDFYLRNALIRLRESKNPDKGVVAAALVDDKVVYATSEKRDCRWVHAERNTLEKYVSEFGLPSNDSKMVISLSPCIKDSDHRYGCSCTELLLGQENPEIFIPRVHVGTIDTLQADTLFYIEKGFEISVTKDKILQRACQGLFEYFLPENYHNKEDYLSRVLAEL